jgi:hypothetical protein
LSDGHRDGLTDIQRRGIESIADVFERFIEQVESLNDRRLPADSDAEAGADLPSDPDPVGIPQLRAAVARTVGLYADLFQQTFDVYADLVEAGLRSRRVAVSAVDGTGSSIRLAGSPGAEARASVWIHNSTDTPLTGSRLRMTDLTSHDGAVIAGSLGTFSPASLEVAASASGSSRLAVTIPATAVAGAYHGHVLATGVPEASLPLHLVVEG